ncbi:MAG: DUF4339 domain-containing protein [Planctomycetota bacterium]|nr:DUF4339 domain-containing protein [Planctomycetota bacterium]
MNVRNLTDATHLQTPCIICLILIHTAQNKEVTIQFDLINKAFSFTKMVRKMTIWFYQLEGQEALGPVPTETLKTLAKNGKLMPTDLIWKEGYEKWVKAKRLQGLFPKSIFVLPPIPDDRKNKTESTSGQNKQENIYEIKIQPKTAKIQDKDSTQINLDQLINPDKNIAQASYNLNKHEPNNNRQDFPPPLPVTTEDAQIWFFSKGKTQYGPISSSELLKLSAIGQINPQDMVWNSDIPDWIPFEETVLFKSKIPKGSLINGKGKTTENVLMSDNYPQKNSGDIISIKTISTTNKSEFLQESFELKTFSKSDNEASIEWRNRKIPGPNGLGVFGKMFSKTIKEFNFSDKVKINKLTESNEPIYSEDILDYLKSSFEKRNFSVQIFETAIIVSKKNTSKSTENLPNIFFQSNSFIKIKETLDKSKWILDIKGEGYYWTKVAEQILTSGFLFIVFILLFWPCICFIPLMFQCPEEEIVKNHIQNEVKEIVEKINFDLI